MIAKLERAIAYRPNVINVYQTAALLGRSLHGRSRYAEAIKVLSVQLTIDPNDTKARQLRGDSYFRVERIDEALADFKANAEQEPDNAEYAGDLRNLQALVDSGSCKRDPASSSGGWVCRPE